MKNTNRHTKHFSVVATLFNGSAAVRPNQIATTLRCYVYLLAVLAAPLLLAANPASKSDSTTKLEMSCPFTVDINSTDATCTDSNGSVSAIPSGGTPSYSYLWSTGDTGSSLTGLVAGTYVVTVTDATGCSVTAIAEVNSLSGGLVDAGPDQTILPGQNVNLDGSADPSVQDLSWTTSGDGSFSDPDNPQATYIPGAGDISNDLVTLTLAGTLAGYGTPLTPGEADYYTVSSGRWNQSSTWAGGSVPPGDLSNKKVLVQHDVQVTDRNIKLQDGSIFYAEGIEFIMYQSYNFTIEVGDATFLNCTFLQHNNSPNNTPNGGDGDGNLEVTTSGGSLTMVGCDVWVAQNFQNSEGNRTLIDVCMKVDENYINIGTDYLERVCVEVAYEEFFLGSGSGNFQNDGPGDMTVIDVDVHTFNGNMQNKSGASIDGNFGAIWVENGNLQNDGSWNASVDDRLCVDQDIQGSYNPPLPLENCSNIASFFCDCQDGPCLNPQDQMLVIIEGLYDLALEKNLSNTTMGPFAPGSIVTFDVVVENEGDVDASNVEVTDVPQAGLVFQSSNAGSNSNLTQLNPDQYIIGSLPTGATETITLTYQIANDFQGFSLTNKARITVDDGDDDDSDPDEDETVDEDGDGDGDDDDEDEETIPVEQTPSVDIEKATNGQDADDPVGVVILIPDNSVQVEWTYVVTNTGTLDLINLVVEDDQEGIVGTIPSLAAGESTTLTLTGDAQLGQYSNLATVTGQPVDEDDNPFGPPVTDEDPSNYVGVYINMEKEGDKTHICPGEEVTFTLTTRMIGGAPGVQFRDIMAEDTNLPITLTPYGTYWVGGDLSGNGYLDFIDNNNDGISDEEFVWSYTLTYEETTTNVATDQATVYVDGQVAIDPDTGEPLMPMGMDDWTVTVSTDYCANLGDFVWEDYNNDGQQDPGEPGIEGVTVNLLDPSMNFIESTTTDPNGIYSFTDLIPGDYMVEFIRPAGFNASPQNQGDDTTDSDADETTGKTGVITLVQSQTDNTIDAGFVNPPDIDMVKDIVSVSPNGDGTYTVSYTVTVTNDGGPGTYTLTDIPLFDDDVTIISGSFSGQNSGNLVDGVNVLATDESIAGGATHTYNLSFVVTLDLEEGSTDGGDNSYTACAVPGNGPGSGPGQGLYNLAELDSDGDGQTDIEDDACGDLPYLTLDKELLSVTPAAGGTYDVSYEISVSNNGGAPGTYTLRDTPFFDGDITINSGSFSGQNSGAMNTSGSTTLNTNESIAAGVSHTYMVTFNVSISLTDGISDDEYMACGSTTGIPQAGEGLFNEAGLDIDGDGQDDLTDDACGDLPALELDKELLSVTPAAAGTYDVSYEIVVSNNGGAPGTYTLRDTPFFDGDITINSGSFSGQTSGAMNTSGSTTLNTNESIAAGASHTYVVTFNVSISLTDGISDDEYFACGSTTGTPQAGEGLFNEAGLDIDGDGQDDLTDDACGDLPALELDKDLLSVTPAGGGTYDVSYTITVTNNGGAAGTYTLRDTPFFDGDITINSGNFTGQNSGAMNTSGSTTLNTNESIGAGVTHSYVVTFNVTLNLTDGISDDEYFACGSSTGTPQAGEGLFNEAGLDIDGDGEDDLTDDACGDLPALQLDKELIDVVAAAGGTYDVSYTITVTNNGGTSATYTLRDTPFFDGDITINSGSFTGQNNGAMNTSGSTTLNTNESIDAGDSHTYQVTFNVTLDLTDGISDDEYTACGSTTGIPQAGEGLFNEAGLDIDGDGEDDLTDDACGDLPGIQLLKSFVSAVPAANGTYDVTYIISVSNTGGTSGMYTLRDTPDFDGDITINNGSFSGQNSGAMNTSGSTTLNTNESTDAGESHTYQVTFNVTLDLTDGISDDEYTACGSTTGIPQAGEGLFNEAGLDIDGDGEDDLTDDACGDLPGIQLLKSFVSAVPAAGGTYDVTYTISVSNTGGTSGMYTLRDTPDFDGDITINSGSFSGQNSGAMNTVGTTILNTNESISAGETHFYEVVFNVTINLSDGESDDVYTACGSTTGTPQAGEGLFNEAGLDIDGDGEDDLTDDACGDIPNIELEKDLLSITEQADGTYDVEYIITVSNTGGALGTYTLRDKPQFDGDITINSGSFTGQNSGAMNTVGSTILNTNESIDAGETHSYIVTFNVSINLNDGISDDEYTPCGSTTGTPQAGEGLFNEAGVDVDGDGEDDLTDDACGDIDPECELEAGTYVQGPCDDNGTADPSDDTYVLTFSSPTVENPAGTFYQLVLDGTVVWNSPYGQGGTIEVPADGLSHLLAWRDAVDINCADARILPPVDPCPEPCMLTVETETECNDDGTFTITFTVTATGTDANEWVGQDPNGDFGGTYGVPVTRTYNQDASSPIVITIQDADLPDCAEELSIDVPDCVDCEIACPPDVDGLVCGDEDDIFNNPASLSEFGTPEVISGNCVILDVDFSDTLEDSADCEYLIIVRTFVVTTSDGQTHTCEQRIFFQRTPPEVSCPTSNHYCPILEDDIMLYTTDPNSCSASFYLPLPEVSGGCQDSYEILSQLLDEDGVVVYTVAPSDSRLLIGVPVGDYTLRFIVTDDCGQSTIQDCYLRVADIEEPTIFCQGGVVASLNGAGIAVAYIEQFLSGTSDNCEVADVEIRRYNTVDPNGCDLLDTPEWSEWGSTVIFTCCDADQYVTVEVRATDIYGNSNTCWVDVLVEDKTLPYCIALEDVTIGCGSLPNDFDAYNTDQLQELFGGPIVIDNCTAGAIELEPTVDWPECSGGTILRRFIAIDQVGNVSSDTLEQLVTIEYELSYAVQLSADVVTECLEEVPGVSVYNTSCDEIEVTYTDEFLPTEDTECRFIERTYVITNLCEWDGQSPAVPVGRDEDCDGDSGEEDVWILRNLDGSFIDADDDASNQMPAAGTAGLFCTGETNPEGYWRSVVSTGRWTYTQRIKVYDLTAPEIVYAATEPFCTTDESCETLVQIPVSITEFCLLEELQINLFLDVNADGVVDVDLTNSEVLTGSLPDLMIEGLFPIGNHAFELVVQDGCLNTALATIPFSVVDCYIPEPTCYDGLLVNLAALDPGTDIDGDGDIDAAAVAVSAFQLMSCDGEDCSAPLQFSVNRVGESANPDQDMIYLTCEDRYSVDLEVYVWDQAFNPFAVQPDGTVGGPNYRTCTVTVSVQDPDLACDYCQTELQVAGSVFNHLDDVG